MGLGALSKPNQRNVNSIGIVTPLPGELRTISDVRIAAGTWAKVDEHTLVALSGAGSDNARLSGELLLSKGATALISWGCAAATDENLRPGDLLLPDGFVAEDGSQHPADVEWQQAVYQNTTNHCQIQTGKMLGVDRLVTSPLEKKALARKHHVIALDMESAALAKLAQQRHVPFIAVRAIVDPADMELPNSICNAMGQWAQVNYFKLLMSLLAHPGDMPGLIKLGRNFQSAQNTLRLVWQRAFGEIPKTGRDTVSSKTLRETFPTKNGHRKGHNKAQCVSG